jgi:hypothetical protein
MDNAAATTGQRINLVFASLVLAIALAWAGFLDVANPWTRYAKLPVVTILLTIAVLLFMRKRWAVVPGIVVAGLALVGHGASSAQHWFHGIMAVLAGAAVVSGVMVLVPVGRRSIGLWIGLAGGVAVVGAAALGVSALAKRLGPGLTRAVAELSAAQEAVRAAVADEPRLAGSSVVVASGPYGHLLGVTVVTRGGDLSDAEFEELTDRIWARLAPRIAPLAFSSVVIQEERSKQVDVGVFHYSDTRRVHHRVIGAPLDDAAVAALFERD